jgi:hypothetical protein
MSQAARAIADDLARSALSPITPFPSGTARPDQSNRTAYGPSAVDPIRAAYGAKKRRRKTPAVELSGQEKARLRRVCDMLVDAEDELLYVVSTDPTLQPHIDAIVTTLVDLTKRAHE